ncbi:hypothetical protein Poli38472_010710 [Pythium oligandrum]|uniref:Uncharacterized protein n=1 Tax=Pythium oligandrum TaxID=41045 RepID=A0A8K1CGC1_PYTOL|nr:hypothetical protein Poli38472_010710 [Pythium oligandrum]|eukprot:TMW61647.1 hypothetical protein Poli38472_010710 [Pythium oligandrum]
MKTLHFNYVTEFIALVEFTEIIMPFIYVVYIVTFSRLSNHEYYQFLQGVTSAQIVRIVANVAIHASLELISLLFLALVLWINYRLSLLHQLAYVLETRFLNVPAKMLPWMLYVANNALVQFGADYSFKFEWLMETKKGD